MTDKITLANLANLENETTAVNAINSNNAILIAAIDNTLSRDGTVPNSMSNNLDMNNNQIINLPTPATTHSPARLIDVVSNPTISVPPTGTSGATVPLLNANNTFSGNNIHSGTETFNGSAAFNGGLTFASITLPANSVSSSNIVDNSVANGDLRQSAGLSVVGNAGSTTANVADISGTAKQLLGVNAGGTALAFALPQGDQLKGTITNDNASSGNIGEYVTSTSSSTGLTNTAPTNLTSISLTAGDWDVNATFAFSGNGATTITGLAGSVSATTGTLDSSANRLVSMIGNIGTANTAGIGVYNLNVGPSRFSLSTTTTIFCVARADFGSNTEACTGTISARRVR